MHALYRRWITITVNSNSSDLILRSGETCEVFLKPGKSSVMYHLSQLHGGILLAEIYTILIA